MPRSKPRSRKKNRWRMRFKDLPKQIDPVKDYPGVFVRRLTLPKLKELQGLADNSLDEEGNVAAGAEDADSIEDLETITAFMWKEMIVDQDQNPFEDMAELEDQLANTDVRMITSILKQVLSQGEETGDTQT